MTSANEVSGHGCIVDGGCVVNVFSALPKLAHLRHFDELVVRSAQSHAALIVITGKPSAPDHAFREKVARIVDSGHVSCAATVVELRGFQAAAARAVMTSTIMLSRSKTPQKVFSSVDEAVLWIAEHDRRVDTPRINDALARARADAERPIETTPFVATVRTKEKAP